jgi:hypothetical protein
VPESKLGHAAKDKRVISIEDAGVRGYNPALKKKEGKKEKTSTSLLVQRPVFALSVITMTHNSQKNIASFLLSENHN